MLTSTLIAGAFGCADSGKDGQNGYKPYSYQFSDVSAGLNPSQEKKEAVVNEYESFLRDLSALPVSFSFEGKEYKGFNGSFKEISRETRDEGEKIATDIVLKKGALEVRIDMAVYPNYCAYEWTVYFTNTGSDRIGPLEGVDSADITFGGKDPYIFANAGDYQLDPVTKAESVRYNPYTVDLTEQPVFEQIQPTGRSSEGGFPYYNLQYGDGGVILAIGWPGSWFSRFDASPDAVHFTAGQAHLNTYIDPGETVRLPLMAFVYYEGRDIDASMNLWRHWFIDCNMPRINGQLIKPMTSATSATYINLAKTTEKEEVNVLNKYLKNDIPLDSYWLDAGWYFKTGTESVSEWLETGNWKVDIGRFPTEFQAISDITAAHGMDFIVWFEPELVRINNSCLDADGMKPEWILGEDGTWRIANLGEPGLVDWVFERLSSIIEKGGVTVYRQDYGTGNPLGNWLANDSPDRVGITENKYVQGYLELWDRLLERFPNMFIDTCASGGGRLDLETLRRSVPLHKTDYDYGDVDTKQSMHQALFQWIPYFGTVTTIGRLDFTSYFLRSSYCCFLADGNDTRYSKFDWNALRRAFDEFHSVKDYYYCDYYPLTEWNYGLTEWRGWEFVDPGTQSGFIQLFCPEKCKTLTYAPKLSGLEPDAVYLLTDADGKLTCSKSGRELMESGLTVSVPESRTSVFITFKKEG